MCVQERVNKTLLTFVIGKLQVVVHGGYEFLNDKSPYNRCQVTFTTHFPLKDFNVVIWKRKEIRDEKG